MQLKKDLFILLLLFKALSLKVKNITQWGNISSPLFSAISDREYSRCDIIRCHTSMDVLFYRR